MLKKFLVFLFLILSISFFIYLILPNPQFPSPLPDALQSREPADSETPLRRAYFTDATRAEVMAHYSKEFKWGIWLNYPPEEAGTIIRDQTRSTFLQEIVHPFRESIYINGYEPSSYDDKNQINIDGRHFRQKITVRFVPSSIFVRVITFALTILSMLFLFKEFKNAKNY